jgi:antitoxin component of MazEF toxin-antitoxin module
MPIGLFQKQKDPQNGRVRRLFGSQSPLIRAAVVVIIMVDSSNVHGSPQYILNRPSGTRESINFSCKPCGNSGRVVLPLRVMSTQLLLQQAETLTLSLIVKNSQLAVAESHRRNSINRDHFL